MEKNNLPLPSPSHLSATDENEVTDNGKVSLLYSKSKVYVHPSSDPEANMVGYLSIVERAPNDYLLAWTPEALIPFCDREAFVYLDSQVDGGLNTGTPQEASRCSSRSSKRRDVLVSIPTASQHSLYATSIPVSNIHSVRVQPPSLSSWYGVLIINLKDGAGDAPLPLWFHDDESDKTMREEMIKWGGDEVVIMLEKLVGGVWSSTEFGLFYLHINNETKEKMFYDKKRPDYLENDPLKMDPLIMAVKEAKWNILEGFSKVTQFYRNSAAQILDHPLGRPLVPFLHPKLAALATSVPARSVMNDFEGARLYLAKWAAGVAAQAKIEQEKEAGSNHGSVNDVWEEATEEDNGFGVWEVLNSDSALPPPEARRIEPLTPEDWLSFYDTEGRLKKSKKEISEMVFRGGVENDIRLDVWKYFLGFWSWGSSEAERVHVKAEKAAAYHELKSQWKSLSPETLDADEQFVEQRHRIEKDVARTDRTVPFFSDSNGPIGRRSSVSECSSPTLNDNLIVLKELLLTYNYYNTELGYVQGMSDLLSPILSVMRDEVDAFWCFVGFMERMEVNFLRDQSGMRDQLETLEALMKFMDPALHKHFERADSTNLFCCFRWLLIWFKREFEFDKVLRLWEVLLSDYLCKDMHLFVALAILDTHRDVFIDHLRNFDEILKYINDLSGTIDVEETLKRAEVLFALFERRLARLERMHAAKNNNEAVLHDKKGGLNERANEGGTKKASSTVPVLHPLICKLVKRYRAFE